MHSNVKFHIRIIIVISDLFQENKSKVTYLYLKINNKNYLFKYWALSESTTVG